MAENIPVPDFLDINEEVQAVASAAMNRNNVLAVPDDAVVNTDKNNDVYKRWTEPAVIDAAWREATEKGLIVAVIQMKIRTGSFNGGQRTWARHMLHPALLTGTATDDIKTRYEFMNNRSINAITTLLSSTGLRTGTGVLGGKLLNFMFPVKNQPGAVSPLKGKVVQANLIDQPNKGANAKSPRQTAVESYLPDTTE